MYLIFLKKPSDFFSYYFAIFSFYVLRNFIFTLILLVFTDRIGFRYITLFWDITWCIFLIKCGIQY